MKSLLLFVAVLTLSLQSYAQPVGDTFPDFTFTDLDGVTHNLQTYLDEGKTVVIDVFATWCPNCQNSVPGWEALYNLHGQGGDESMVLLSFERDPNTTNEAQYIQQYGLESPVITGAESLINSTWNVTYQPRYFVICSDGTFDDVFSTPIGNNPQPLIDQADNCPSVINGIEELRTDDFNFFIQNGATINYQSTYSNLDYQILDVTGSTVKFGQLESTQGLIDVADLYNGVYLISLRNDNSVITLRFLKQ